MEVRVIDSDSKDYKLKSFEVKTWDMLIDSGRKMILKLNFDEPENVSKLSVDTLQIIFWDVRYFATQAIPTQNVRGGTTIEKDFTGVSAPVLFVIPKQKKKKLKKIRADTAAAVKSTSVAASLGTVIANLILSASLTQMWSMINTQQIIVMIPLFKIEVPEQVWPFFRTIMELAAFDIVPDSAFDFVFALDDKNKPEPITDNFGVVGFETTLFISNMGSPFIYMTLYPIMVVTSLLLRTLYSN
jgi:hypothetical protein